MQTSKQQIGLLAANLSTSWRSLLHVKAVLWSHWSPSQATGVPHPFHNTPTAGSVRQSPAVTHFPNDSASIWPPGLGHPALGASRSTVHVLHGSPRVTLGCAAAGPDGTHVSSSTCERNAGDKFQNGGVISGKAGTEG